MSRRIAAILFPLPLPEAFDYVVPEDVEGQPGQLLRHPSRRMRVLMMASNSQTEE